MFTPATRMFSLQEAKDNYNHGATVAPALAVRYVVRAEHIIAGIRPGCTHMILAKEYHSGESLGVGVTAAGRPASAPKSCVCYQALGAEVAWYNMTIVIRQPPPTPAPDESISETQLVFRPRQ